MHPNVWAFKKLIKLIWKSQVLLKKQTLQIILLFNSFDTTSDNNNNIICTYIHTIWIMGYGDTC